VGMWSGSSSMSTATRYDEKGWRATFYLPLWHPWLRINRVAQDFGRIVRSARSRSRRAISIGSPVSQLRRLEPNLVLR
jgi:hypothetical protein